MKAKLLRQRRDCTVGKVYEVEPLGDSFFTFYDDVQDRNEAKRNDFEVIPDETSEEPAATTNVVIDGAEPAIRTFETGATRNLDSSKNDYEGFLSPFVIKSFGDYMTSHRKQKDGTLRDSDNWQKGIPIDVYMKSMFRHFMDVWTIHRGGTAISPDTGEQVDLIEALNAVLFNVQGMMHETLKKESQK